MHLRKTVLSFFCTLLTFCISLQASAQEKKKLGVLDFSGNKISKELIAEASRATKELIESPLFEGRYTVVTGNSLTSMALLVGCTTMDESCLEQVAKTLGVSVVVYGELKSNKETFSIELRSFDSEKAKGSRLSTSVVRDNISPSQIAGTVRAMAATLFGKALPAKLVISTNQGGAEVSIDGQKRGVVPFTQDVAPGTHLIEISKKGFVTSAQQINLQSSESKELFITLTPEAVQGPFAGPTEASPLAKKLKLVGASSAGFGVLTGLYWLSKLGAASQIATAQGLDRDVLGLSEEEFNEINEQISAEFANNSPRLCDSKARDIIYSVNTSGSAQKKIDPICRAEIFGVPSLLFIIGGASAYVVGTSMKPVPATGKETATPKQSALQPYVSPTGAGVSLQLSF